MIPFAVSPLTVLLLMFVLIVPLPYWITRMPLALFPRPVMVLLCTVALMIEVSKLWMLITFKPFAGLVPVLRPVKPETVAVIKALLADAILIAEPRLPL